MIFIADGHTLKKQGCKIDLRSPERLAERGYNTLIIEIGPFNDYIMIHGAKVNRDDY